MAVTYLKKVLERTDSNDTKTPATLAWMLADIDAVGDDADGVFSRRPGGLRGKVVLSESARAGAGRHRPESVTSDLPYTCRHQFRGSEAEEVTP